MSASKRKGTAWESAIVTYLREHHDPSARRNVQMGAKDIGDIDGYHLHAVEAKAEKTITLADYVAQANREAINAGKSYGCAVVKRRMKGTADAYVVRDLATDVRLMNRLRDMEAALKDASFDLWFDIDEEHREEA
ncbi:hypothetical protein [Streptomyces sp. SM8]|uniref:hypothetical protein n=1 Tax=Streptomyces sp. SM8 TaxID=1195457 RepID=UPI000283112B|nr:hypothetical protein [Streptomyces sp. SM8]PKA37933.1 hypothetical protein SM8_029375 [Streptomyces sp. SM8]